MAPTTRALRVALDGDDGSIAAVLDPAAELVDEGAQVLVAAISGEVGEAAIERLTAARAAAGAPAVAVVDGRLTPRKARALAASSEGIVERDKLATSLVPTLHAVAVGQAVVPVWMHRALERPPLSNREKQILAMVVLGLSNAEIATRLVVTESTVKNHLSSAFAKLGVRSRAAAASLILDPATGLGLGVLQLSPGRDG